MIVLLACLPLAHAQTPAAPAPAPAASTPAPATPAPGRGVVGDRNVLLSDRIPPEQQLELQAGDDKFSGRYLADLSPEHRGAVLVLQDSGQHQSWPRTVAALFDDLPLHGWSVLAVELPPPAQDAVTAPNASTRPTAPATPGALLTGSEEGAEKQAQARIDAAVQKLAELNQNAAQPTVLIGFGSGAWRAAEFARRRAEGNGARRPEPLRALVLVDPRNRLPAARADLPKLLPATELATLDIVQSSEPPVRADAEARRRAVLKQKGRIYRQLALPPLNALDSGDQTTLIRRIRGWIQVHAVAGDKGGNKEAR